MFSFFFVWSVDEIKRQQNRKSSTLYSKYSQSVDWKKLHLTFSKFLFVLRGGKMNSTYVRGEKKTFFFPTQGKKNTLKTSRRRVTWEWDASNLCRRSWASGEERSESRMRRYQSRMRRHMSHEWKDKLWVTNEKTRHESRMRCLKSLSSIRSIWLRESWVTNVWVTNEKTHHESRMRRRNKSHEWDVSNLSRRSGWERGESRMIHEWGNKWWVTSHEWKDIWWVANEKAHHGVMNATTQYESQMRKKTRVTSEKTHESRMRRHIMSDEREDTWVTNKDISVTNEKTYESRMRWHMSEE